VVPIDDGRAVRCAAVGAPGGRVLLVAGEVVESMYPVTLELALAAVTEVLMAKFETQVEVSVETRFADLGLDSVDYAVGFIVLEDLVGVELDPDSAVDLHRVADLTAIRAASPHSMDPASA
jgi:acyl carrier protein